MNSKTMALDKTHTGLITVATFLLTKSNGIQTRDGRFIRLQKSEEMTNFCERYGAQASLLSCTHLTLGSRGHSSSLFGLLNDTTTGSKRTGFASETHVTNAHDRKLNQLT